MVSNVAHGPTNDWLIDQSLVLPQNSELKIPMIKSRKRCVSKEYSDLLLMDIQSWAELNTEPTTFVKEI